MIKPVILTVDDDREVLAAIERDLKIQYRQRYRIVAAETPAEALEAVRELKRRNTPVALFLVDQRMPGMTGTQWLVEARKLYPEAARVLLTAYADTEAAIAAINDVAINHYLLKPWDPPEQKLYPVLDDLLAEWSGRVRVPFDGIRVVGSRWSPQSYAARDFLARNQVPYQWVDLDTDAPAREIVKTSPVTRRSCRWCCFQTGRRWWHHRRRIWRPRSACTRRRAALLRSGDHRRRSGGAGERRVCDFGGTEDHPHRTGRAGRSGGHELADRELPRLPGRRHRRRPRAARDRTGATLWHGTGGRARGGVCASRGSLSHRPSSATGTKSPVTRS